jgi:hypothetical protein
MLIRGASRAEVEKTIHEGEKSPARKGRIAFAKNFPYEAKWKRKFYSTKQIKVIIKEEAGRYIVVTVFCFYFGGD